jgi:Protein kinase domain
VDSDSDENHTLDEDDINDAKEVKSRMPTSVQESTSSISVPSSNLASSGLNYVLEYMNMIKPSEDGNGISSWSQVQMEATPTYLPDLKFHDLVFGQELGVGAFGCVKYARHIHKKKSRSQWAEYAVKIVSTDKIKVTGYEASIQREIATLHILSHHPGIARLVSSFRFREGAYLVLEYASKGDLHTLLHQHGSLDNDSTRFVIGEVVAALASIHGMGFVYGTFVLMYRDDVLRMEGSTALFGCFVLFLFLTPSILLIRFSIPR